MDVIKKLFSRMPSLRSVKYILALGVAVALICFGSGNSLLAHFSYKHRVSELQAEIDHYDSEYRRDQAQMRCLQHSPKMMERIARERYFMKAPDEDIFVLSDDALQQQSKDFGDETVE